jgi:hypothetical protein
MSKDFDHIADLTDDYTLVDDRFEIDLVLDRISADREELVGGSLYVNVEGGEYADVLWFNGCVPYLNKPLTRVK